MRQQVTAHAMFAQTKTTKHDRTHVRVRDFFADLLELYLLTINHQPERHTAVNWSGIRITTCFIHDLLYSLPLVQAPEIAL